MPWLPSFVKLFLLFVTGLVLLLVGSIGELQLVDNGMLRNLFGALYLVGLLLMVGSPLLIGLKFFDRLDRKPK
ncbi:hypothetical protein GCM10028824_41480 [Hymenobacter segetis]|uniref:Uncharacterized protein n=1 Tax=Hymenobacter segetis TaxID=2025509 RepID=A0ABU9LZH1_9BACT